MYFTKNNLLILWIRELSFLVKTIDLQLTLSIRMYLSKILEEEKMETRKLGSNFEISAIGLGCMGMTHGFGDASDQKEMIEVIRGAYQAGITMFDTAECYQGVSETGEILYNEDLVGQALSIYPRDSYQIATKCGIKVI